MPAKLWLVGVREGGEAEGAAGTAGIMTRMTLSIRNAWPVAYRASQ